MDDIEDSLILVIEWFASEEKHLLELQRTFERIRSEKGRKRLLDLKKAVGLLDYLYAYEERINKIAGRWTTPDGIIEKLMSIDPQIAEKYSLLMRVNEKIERFWMDERDVLLQIGKEYTALLENMSPAQLKLQLSEDQGAPSHFQEIFNHLIEETKEINAMITSLDSAFRKANNLLKRYHEENPGNVIEEVGKGSMSHHSFFKEPDPDYKKFLQQHPSDLRYLSSKGDYYVQYLDFVEGLVTSKKVPWERIVLDFEKLVIKSKKWENDDGVLGTFYQIIPSIQDGVVTWDEAIKEFNWFLQVKKDIYVDHIISDYTRILFKIVHRKGATLREALNIIKKLTDMELNQGQLRRILVFSLGSLEKTICSGKLSLQDAIEGLLRINSETKNEVHVLKYGIPIASGVVIEDLGTFNHLFQREVSDLINTEINWRDFVEGYITLGNSCKHRTEDMFQYGVFFVRVLLGKGYSWKEIVNGFIRMGDAAYYKEGFGEILQPLMEGLITWEDIIQTFPSLGQTLGESYCKKVINSIFKATEESLRSNKLTWIEIYEGVLKIQKSCKKEIFNIIGEFIFLSAKELMENKNISWNQIVDGFCKLGSIQKDGIGFALIYSHPAFFIRIINKNNWDLFMDFSVQMGKSKGKLIELTGLISALPEDFEEEMIVFFEYLMVNNPNKVVDVIRNYSLIKALKMGFKEELQLFLSIANPLMFKTKELDKVKIIVVPIGSLPPRIKKFFLGKLNKNFITFQGMNADFVKSFNSTEGLGDINEYSYMELVYIYLKFARNPELKLRKLKKSIFKLRKHEKNILNIISNNKTIYDLKGIAPKRLSENFGKVGQMFFDMVNHLYIDVSEDKILLNLERKFNMGARTIKENIKNQSFLNSLLVLNRLEKREDLEEFSNHCFYLIKNALLNNTYPKKRILKSYPFSLEKNQTWLRKNVKNKYWYKDFRKKYKITKEDLKKDNTEERIKNHLNECSRILNELKIDFGELNFENVEKIYKILAEKKDKYDENLISDLRTQIDGIKSTRGVKRMHENFSKQIIIQPEFDPLEILQMGNYINGSCLSTGGANYWSTVVNAIDVNKRVLWAKDSKGEVLARVLIAVDSNQNIVRFPTYYATNIDLDPFFNDYIIDLSKKCGYGLNGDSKKVINLNTKKWYVDPEVEIAA